MITIVMVTIVMVLAYMKFSDQSQNQQTTKLKSPQNVPHIWYLGYYAWYLGYYAWYLGYYAKMRFLLSNDSCTH